MNLLPDTTSASLINHVHHMDIFELCERVYRAGVQVDMGLFDLPYATTQISWDFMIDLAAFWKAVTRIMKPNAPMVFTATQPFTSKLVMSNLEMYRCEWIWEKSTGTGFLDANRRPMKCHESILVFSKAQENYYPQMVEVKQRTIRRSAAASQYGKHERTITDNDGKGYPRSIVYAPKELGTKHPTQKPVSLFRYLIRTYSLPGNLVIDPMCGSGTAGVAARAEGRNYIINDNELQYVAIANERLHPTFAKSQAMEVVAVDDLPLFKPALESA